MDHNLVETSKYLSAFFGSKFEEYRADEREYRPGNGYGQYFRCHEITQSMRDIVLNIQEQFADFRIPEKDASPQHLIETLRRFQRLLVRNNVLYDSVCKHFEGKEKPEPLHVAYNMNNEVLSAIDHVLLFDEINAYDESRKNQMKKDVSSQLAHLIRILDRFGDVARQLLIRRNDSGSPRATLKIADEYDCQDLMHALLKIDFDDVRPGEWAPSYAGKSSRTDFLLKAEKIVVEVKKTRRQLAGKEVGEELTLDAAKYRGHPDAKTLVCFVYDPEKKSPIPRD